MSAFGYVLSITGTCDNNIGSALITGSGGVPPYTFDWYDPDLGTGPYKTNLAAGTYLVRANDSTAPVNNEFYINVQVGDSFELDLISVTGTTCGDNNGYVRVSADTDNNIVDWYLYTGSTYLIDSTSTNDGFAEFDNLAPGTYYILGQNGAGCSGTTAEFIVYTSSTLDYGFYIVNDTQCASPTGKIFVTGATGTGPYTYLWDNQTTQSSLTNLFEGTYEVTVTDAYGCQATKTATVDFVDALGLGSWSAQTPTCFTSDGALKLTITGGTAPYFYSGSNGTTIVTYNTSYIFYNLPSGTFNVSVTDAALCKEIFGTVLQTPDSFSSISVVASNSTCNGDDGSINVSLEGGLIPYVYSLTAPGFDTISITTNSTGYIFTNLPSNTYTLTIDDGGTCTYTETVVLTSTNLFTVSTSTTQATCNTENGTATLTLTEGGTTPYVYTLSDGQTITTNDTSATFSSLGSGTYTYTVTDATGCSQEGNFTVNGQTPVLFTLFPTTCGSTGSQGTITALITSGTPPYTYEWSTNVAGNPQDVYVTGLSADTYSLTITDSNECVDTKSVEITCNSVSVSYQIYQMCATEFTFESGTKRGILQMLNEGYNDVIVGHTDCLFSAATFAVVVDVTGSTYTDIFYTGYTLLDIPTDSEYFQAVEDLLLTITPGITGVTIDETTSQITIETAGGLASSQITISLEIDYFINCVT